MERSAVLYADAREMGAWGHGGGFSVDASARIEGADRAGLERLLRYCARAPFAPEQLRPLDAKRLIYESAKHGPGGSGRLMLTPLELIERLAARVLSPRIHCHRYFGVLAPNATMRAAVTLIAAGTAETTAPAPAKSDP